MRKNSRTKKNKTTSIFNKMYEDFKNNQKIKEKKELKIREDQIKKDLDKIKVKDRDIRTKEEDLKKKEDILKVKDNDLKLCEMAHNIENGCNDNEVNLIPKNPKKKGFFEKFFQLFG